ncbi:hypothetical protein MRB53_004580 [Persea americana]|uniref:Uncharacterized protein n=1 Tax=Persea americana TaxID=3435 RepID=A0ACC2MAZ8_PERAE|nr:hypothetical protein MRB53_004580 [Persea americana]
MSAGTQYKCYIAPRTGCKFYSKQEVFRYLKSGKIDGKAPQTKRRTLNVLSADNVVSRIEKSPDGLPPGWTKEIKFRKKRGDGFRRDPYYTESATGYIFRSLRDVIRYLETGDVGIHVSKPKKMCTSAKDSTDNKPSSPVTAKRQKLTGNSAKRRLFESQCSNVKGATAEQISGSTIDEQCAEDVDSRSLGCTRKHPKTRKRKMVQVKKPSFTAEDKLAGSRDKKLLVNGVILESEDKNKELKTDQQLTQNTAMSELEVVQQENKVLLEAGNRKLSCSGVPLESSASNHTGNEVLLGPRYGKPSDNCMSMESDDTKQQIENQTLETHKHLVQNMVFSELEDEKQESGALLESRNEKLSGEVLPESGANNQVVNETLPELQGRKQSEAIVSEETKPLENGALPELQRRKQSEVIVSENTKPLENGARFESEVKTALEENCKSGTRLRSRKAKAEKATLPRRASKRLAGFEAEGVALDITPPKRSHRVATMQLEADHALESTPSSLAEQVSEQLDQLIFNLQVDPTHDVGSTLSFCAEQASKPNDESKFSLQADCSPCTPQGNKGTEGQPEKHVDCTPLGNKRTEEQPEKPLVEEPQLDEKPEYPPILPFGDSWLDPCIEFAFKTLTGDIPEVMDTTAIEDYFQQQLEVSPPQNLASDGMLQSELLFQPSKDVVVGPVEGGKPEEKGKHH